MWVEITPDDGPSELRRKASTVRPSPRQVRWQRQELTAFVHFGPNTFTGLEWGTGLDDPAVFDPSALDCAQWAKALAAAEFRSVILTAKHHDGFCLWPSRYLEHTVAASPYPRRCRGLAGDGVPRQHGLGVGVLSVAGGSVSGEGGRWVLRERQPGGDVGRSLRWWRATIGVAAAVRLEYVVDDYNRFYLNQLYELLTQYGPIAEVWLDGANPTGTAQAYDVRAPGST